MTAHFSLAHARNERTSCQRPNPSTYSPARIACEIAPSATPTTASIEWPRAAQCAQPHAKKAPPTSSSARRRLRDAILSGAGRRLVCGGARSTLGRAPRRGGGRWGSPARRFRLFQPERSERGRELAALLGAQAECHPRPGRRAGVANNGSPARGVVVSTDPISTRFGVSSRRIDADRLLSL